MLLKISHIEIFYNDQIDTYFCQGYLITFVTFESENLTDVLYIYIHTGNARTSHSNYSIKRQLRTIDSSDCENQAPPQHFSGMCHIKYAACNSQRIRTCLNHSQSLIINNIN